jgi:fatty-acyl-CoA synthase
MIDLKSLIGLVFTSAAVNHLLVERITRELKLIFFMVGYGSIEAGSVVNGTCLFSESEEQPGIVIIIQFI